MPNLVGYFIRCYPANPQPAPPIYYNNAKHMGSRIDSKVAETSSTSYYNEQFQKKTRNVWATVPFACPFKKGQNMDPTWLMTWIRYGIQMLLA